MSINNRQLKKERAEANLGYGCHYYYFNVTRSLEVSCPEQILWFQAANRDPGSFTFLLSSSSGCAHLVRVPRELPHSLDGRGRGWGGQRAAVH